MVIEEIIQIKELLNEDDVVTIVLNSYAMTTIKCRIGDTEILGIKNSQAVLLSVQDKDGDKVFFSVSSIVSVIKKKD